jgi:hypothetical protein
VTPEALCPKSRFFDRARRAIEGRGGTVEKLVGDAVMAVFGVPQAHEDDALRAAGAAVDIRDALGALRDELDLDVDARVGSTPARSSPAIPPTATASQRVTSSTSPRASNRPPRRERSCSARAPTAESRGPSTPTNSTRSS